MTLSSRLTRLMKVVGINSKQLAVGIHVDPSRISQLKTGKRGLPKNRDIIHLIAAFCSEWITTESQRFLLAENIGNEAVRYVRDKKELETIIYCWLCNESRETKYFEKLLHSMPNAVGDSSIQRITIAPGDNNPESDSYICKYHPISNEEKREIVRRIFEELMLDTAPGLILCGFDENLTWIIEDATFFSDIKAMFLILLKKGFHINHIMNTVTNNYDSNMIWLRAYMEGTVTPYYYPRIRDGLFRNSFVIYPGHFAFSSTSFENATTSMMLTYTKESEHVQGWARYYQNYFDVCRTGLKIYTEVEEVISSYIHQKSLHTDIYHLGFTLSAETMPRQLTDKYLAQGTDMERYNGKRILEQYEMDSIQRSKKQYAVIDICQMATPQQVREGKVPLMPPGMIYDSERYYSPKEYADHLENILNLLEENPEYSFYPIPYVEDKKESMFIKRDISAILLNVEEQVMYEVEFPGLVNVMMEYLLRRAEAESPSYNNRLRTKIILQGYIAELRA